MKRKTWTDAELLDILKMKDRGVTYAEMGRRLGASGESCRMAWKRLEAEYKASE